MEGRAAVKLFRAPKETLGDLDAEAAAAVIAAAADVALVIAEDGTIRDVAFGSEELAAEWQGRWVGRRWSDIVTPESRPKIEAMLAEAASQAAPRWRQVNHPAARGVDVPVIYATVRVGRAGPVVAVGRDLRAVAVLQQRLIDVQQSMERDFARLRHAETRYRLLFEVTAEPVLIVDALSQRILDANPAATQLFGQGTRRLLGRTFPEGFDAESMQAIQAMLAVARATGRTGDVRARAADGSQEWSVSASLFRQDAQAQFLIRVVPPGGHAGVTAAPDVKTQLLKLVDAAPDGLVVTGRDGRIVAANAAFLDLAQLATEEQARGESLDRWLGRPGVDLNVLLANLKQHGVVRLFATTLRGEYGASTEIEVSAAALPNGEGSGYGFAIRSVGRRVPAIGGGGRQLPRSVEQLTELVGRVPLKDLVRETTDVIERLCIEAALELTGDNRASAAEILGLSRQSLYVKLRRYGLGDLDAEAES